MTDNHTVEEEKSELYLLFGVTGLLGSSLLEQLLARGKKVRVFVRRPISYDRVEQFLGDIRNEEDVRKAVNGADVVFQTVSIIDWNPRQPDLLYDVNVKGNHYVIEACVDFGVKKLIYTSSIDVVFDGHNLHYADETTPYPKNTSIPTLTPKPLLKKKLLLQMDVQMEKRGFSRVHCERQGFMVPGTGFECQMSLRRSVREILLVWVMELPFLAMFMSKMLLMHTSWLRKNLKKVPR